MENEKPKPFVTGLKIGAGILAALAGGLFVKGCSEYEIKRRAALEADCDAKGGRLITISSERICLSRDGRIIGGTVF